MKPKRWLWALVLLLTFSLAAALGLRPATTAMVFDEIRDYSGTLWVVNNEGKEFSVQVGVEGEMGQYVTLHTSELSFRSDDAAKPIDFEVHLPESVPPGESRAVLVVQETLEKGSPNVISSQLVLKHNIFVQGPYPDKYITAKLNFHESGQEIRFVSEVENKGKKDIGVLKTTFYVNDRQQTSHALETEETSLPTKETKLLDARIPRSLFELGEFEVSAVTTYDDQKVELVKKLIIGQPAVEITYFDQYFTAHKINPYSMDLLNKWNQQLENVFVEVEVKKGGQKIDQFRTKSVDLEAEMAQRINDYFDARDKGPGIYAFDMVVNFWNLVRDAQKAFHFESELLAEGETALSSSLAGRASSNFLDKQKAKVESSEPRLYLPGSYFSLVGWLVAAVLLLGIFCYVFWRYRHREEYEGGKDAL
ncbi:MAG: hypothetical protein AABX13_01900 [Nanoarchaeota archaeon]